VRFEDFVLQLDAGSRGAFRAQVLNSPFGEGAVEFSLPWLADARPAPHNESGTPRDVRCQGTAAAFEGLQPLEIGTELFRSVFQGQVRTLLDMSLGQLEASQDLGLRLKIKLDLRQKATRSLADLPWELLCDGETEDFFVLSRQTSLVRYLDVRRPSRPIPFTTPLRILAVAASPSGLQPLDLGVEAQGIEDLKRSSSGVEVKFLPHASVAAVREALAGDTYHVLHFMGHCTFDRPSGEGMLVFEGSGGSPDPVSGKALATKLKGLRSLGVVVVNACNTAQASYQDGANPFRGVATALVLGGIPAVVAMQRPISDRAAVAFSTAFYRHLARSDSIDEALTEGRQAIHSVRPETFEWATPALFLRIPEGNVFVAQPKGEPRAITPAPLSVPGIKYALGIVVLLAVLAIAGTLKLDYRVAVVGSAFVVVGMLVLRFFDESVSQDQKLPALILKWFALLIFIGTFVLLISSIFIGYPLDLRHWLTGDSLTSSNDSTIYPADGAPVNTDDRSRQNRMFPTGAPPPQSPLGNKMRLIVRFPKQNETIHLRERDALEVRGEISGLPTSGARRTAHSVLVVIQGPQGKSLGSDRSPVTEEMTWRVALKPALLQSETNVFLAVYLEGSDRRRLEEDVRRITLIKED